MRVLLTAGHDRALHVIALAERLRRGGVTVTDVVVVTPFDLKRARQMLRQRGPALVGEALRRLAPRPPSGGVPGPLWSMLAEHGIRDRSLRGWARRYGARYHRVRDLNGEAAVRAVRESGAELVLYGGGGILRPAFLNAARRRVLNAHAGPLPAIRGMNAAEWAVLLGHAPAVTIHYIDEGIDTGAVVELVPVELRPGDGIEELRERCTVAGVEGLLRAASGAAPPPAASSAGAAAERQCFIMAPAVRELLASRLAAAGEAP
jgi:hypothetical protein